MLEKQPWEICRPPPLSCLSKIGQVCPQKTYTSDINNVHRVFFILKN